MAAMTVDAHVTRRCCGHMGGVWVALVRSRAQGLGFRI